MSEELISLYILVSMVVFLVLAVGIIVFLTQAQHKVNKIMLLEKERELTFRTDMLKNTVKTQEIERSRIASELHDDIASKLNIIHLNVHLLKKSQLSESDLILIDQIETSLSMSIERTRTISHELMPQILRKFGIYHALNELAYSVNITQSLEVKIQDEHLLQIADDLKNLHIYRIIQELMQNTLKYAKAKNVNIRFWAEEGNIINLDYSDDGIGFDVHNTKTGLGMNNILTRAKLLDGNATFTSTPEVKGMLFNIKFLNNG